MAKSDIRMALHSASLGPTDLVTDIRAARTAGYDGIEIWIPKLARHLDAGYAVDDVARSLGPLRVTMLDCLLPIERGDRAFRAMLRRDCDYYAAIAARLYCPALQVVVLDEFDAADWPSVRASIAAALQELSDVAAVHGVRLGLEPVTFSRFRSLEHAVEILDIVGTDRVGLVLDTWHLWTSRVPWEEVATLDAHMVVAVHLADCGPRAGQEWSDDDRTALPGTGVVPLQDAVAAIRETNYSGMWTVEMLSKRHWQWNPDVLALEMLRAANTVMSVQQRSD